MTPSATHSFAEERRAAIMAMLDRSASVQVAELARTFGVSAVTIRTDLDALEADGKLRRTHGGAVSLHKTLTVSIQDRRVNVNVAAKQAIARAAIELVDDGNALLVDSGTTALEFVRMLGSKSDITVVTADVTVANFIDESLPSVDAICWAVRCAKATATCTARSPCARSSPACRQGLPCPTALVPGRGFMTNYEQMAEVKAGMMRAAGARIVLMDASKVNGSGLFRFAGIDDADVIVMDRDPQGLVATELEALENAATRPRLVLAQP